MKSSESTASENCDRVIRMRQLTEMMSVSRSTIYDWMNPRSPRYDPDFPLPKKLSGSTKSVATGWLEREVQSWMKARFAEMRK